MKYISGETVKIGDHVLIEDGRTKARVKYILDTAEKYIACNLTEPCLILESKPFGLVSWQVEDNMVFIGRAQ